jgi:hypothetical protein
MSSQQNTSGRGTTPAGRPQQSRNQQVQPQFQQVQPQFQPQPQFQQHPQFQHQVQQVRQQAQPQVQQPQVQQPQVQQPQVQQPQVQQVRQQAQPQVQQPQVQQPQVQQPQVQQVQQVRQQAQPQVQQHQVQQAHARPQSAMPLRKPETNGVTPSKPIELPLDGTMIYAMQLAIKQDKPIILTFWGDSLQKNICYLYDENADVDDNGNKKGETIIFKSPEEYTSPIVQKYNNKSDVICETENSLYIIRAGMETKNA